MKKKLLALSLLTSIVFTACGDIRVPQETVQSNVSKETIKDANSIVEETKKDNDKVVKNTYENWANYVVSIDGIEVKLPLTYREFVELGFDSDCTYEDKLLTEQLDTFMIKENFCGGTDKYYGFWNHTDSTEGIYALLENDSDKEKALGDCLVVGISFPHAEEGAEQDRQFYTGTIKVINKDNGEELTIGSATYDEWVNFFYGNKGKEVSDNNIVFTPPELKNTDDDYESHYISIYFRKDGISDDYKFSFRNFATK